MWKQIFIYIMMSLAVVRGRTYTNYTIFKIAPTQKQLELIKTLERTTDQFSFWMVSEVDSNVNIMVSPDKLSEFYNTMETMGITYNIIINNVQDLIDFSKRHNIHHRHSPDRFDFSKYATLQEIYDSLEYLANNNPRHIKIIRAGKTHQGRVIKGLKISYNPELSNPGVVLESGIHGDEWIAPATIMYIIYALVTKNSDDIRALINSYDWYVFPVINPDGYEYTHTTDRLWRKTLKPYTDTCIGADLNRNWIFDWKFDSQTLRDCDYNFPGSAPLSEIEASSMANYLSSISDKFFAFISFRGSGQHLVFPNVLAAENYNTAHKLYTIANKTVQVLKERYGTQYDFGRIPDILLVRTGGLATYVQRRFRTRLVFEYHLRDKGRYGNLLPADQIAPTGEETLFSLMAMLKESKRLRYSA